MWETTPWKIQTSSSRIEMISIAVQVCCVYQLAEMPVVCRLNPIPCIIGFSSSHSPVLYAFQLCFTFLKWKEVPPSLCLLKILMGENMSISLLSGKIHFPDYCKTLKIGSFNIGFWEVLIFRSVSFQFFTLTSLHSSLCFRAQLW